MGSKSVHRSSPVNSPQPLSDQLGMSDSIALDADAKVAANEAQLLEERQVNPLWMITVALAVLFGLGILLMIE